MPAEVSPRLLFPLNWPQYHGQVRWKPSSGTDGFRPGANENSNRQRKPFIGCRVVHDVVVLRNIVFGRDLVACNHLILALNSGKG